MNHKQLLTAALFPRKSVLKVLFVEYTLCEFKKNEIKTKTRVKIEIKIWRKDANH